jgi:hypothetical protein
MGRIASGEINVYFKKGKKGESKRNIVPNAQILNERK